MKVIKKDFKKGFLQVKVETPEDLWYLSEIIEEGDRVKGKAERKIKLGGEGEKAKVVRKVMTVEIMVEKVDFGNGLRVLGTITQGPDDLPRGSHQSITFENSELVTISKDQWLSFQIQKIKEAQQPSANILMVVFDREDAVYGKLTGKGLQVLTQLKGNVAKKDVDNQSSNFFKEIAKELKTYAERLKPEHVIIASPSFWKEYLKKELGEFKVIEASCSDVSENALHEVMKRPELTTALEKSRASKDEQIINKLLGEISKENAFYGIKETKEKVDMGNVKQLLVSEVFLKKQKEKGNYKELENIMRSAENHKAELMLIGNNKQLDGLGGIAGILRWKEH